MTATRQSAWLALCLIGSTTSVVVMAVIGAGAQQQRSSRPYIPRASEVRPITRSQPPALPQAPSAGSKVPGVEPPPAAKPDPDNKQGGLDMDDTKWDEKTDVTTGINLRYKQGEMVVTGAKARYKKLSKDAGLLNAEGNLIMDDPKYHITGDKGSYDSRSGVKLAVMTGSVVIVIKPKDKPSDPNASDVASEKSNGGTIYCDHVDYYRAKKFAVLTGHLVFKQKIKKDDGRTVERTLTAEHAEHDQKTDKLHLFAPVDFKDTEEQDGHFDKDVFVGTKEGEETLESAGHFKGTFNVSSDEDDKGTSSATDKTSDSSKKSDDAGKDAPVTGKQDAPATTPDKKQDMPTTTPDKKQDPPVKKT